MARKPESGGNRVTEIIGNAVEVERQANAVREVRKMRQSGPELLPTPRADDDFPGGGGPGDGGGDAETINLVDPKDPLHLAERFRDQVYTRGLWLALRLFQGDWWLYAGAGWRRVDQLEIETTAYAWLKGCRRAGRGERPERVKPNARLVFNVLHPLRGLVRLPDDFAGGWLPTDDPEAAAVIADAPPPAEILPAANGLLHIPEGLLMRPTPAYFAMSTCPIAYDENAAAPKRWLTMLEEIWPEDRESRDTLQEVAGYLLAGGTELHKIVMLIGPPRSGKSTIAEIFARLVGPDNTCSPTLNSLGTRFGREQLIGKRLGIIPDARLGRFADGGEIVQTLLTISGEDRATVERKNRSEWNGRLGTKFLLVSNELPALGDASGAFSSRLVLLQMERSFLGSEDPQLREKLAAELPGILLWALEGWRRLRKRGRFRQPQSGDDALLVLRDLGSDMQAFISERCELGPDFKVRTCDLFEAYAKYRSDQGLDRMTQPQFGKRFKAACPAVKRIQPREGYARMAYYSGIKFRDDLFSEGENHGNA